jgi:predicted alpha-1,2-mannosidase
MFNRRDVLAMPVLAAPLAGIAATVPGGSEPVGAVDPFIGTGGHGHTYPGATVPFGAVQLSPDTNVAGWDASSGYHYADPTIMGFSHTHLSGTGCGDMLDVLVVPRSGPIPLDPGESQRPVAGYHSRFDRTNRALQPGEGLTADRGYRSKFDHASEHAEPGYYRVVLDDAGVAAELTATVRAGLHRYRFVAGGQAHVLIDWAHGARDADHDPDYGPTRISEAWLDMRADGTLLGGRRVHGWADGRLIHFAMKFSEQPQGVTFYSNDHAVADAHHGVTGAQLKCALDFGALGDRVLLVKVGLSAVDAEGALRNLDAEIPAWDFDGVRRAASEAWNQELGRIAVTGGDARQRRIFSTALYHSFVAPTVFSDVDGRYRGMDSAIHTLEPREENFSTYSLWDIYRAVGPLFSLVQPERSTKMIRNLIRMTEESPYGPPIWPLQGAETFCMIAWHSVVMIAEAVTKGLPPADCRRAWAALRFHAFEDRSLDLGYYRTKGYMPCDRVPESVSKTLEIAYDDWALARIAQAAGAHDDADALRRRSLCYFNLYDPGVGFMRPKFDDGGWAEPFDPREVGHVPGRKDYTESDAWQATFVPQHALENYIALHGGPKAFEAKLDAFFAASPDMSIYADPDIAGMVGQYAHGNEPCHHIAYLYAYIGAPHKTQALVRRLLLTMYDAAPDGIAGNEDCGQMSAWYVMSAMGLYAVDPVSGIYILGSPLFDSASLQLAGGKKLTIVAHGNAPDRPYVRAVRWNGVRSRKLWIEHATLIEGGVLEFEMSADPDPVLGVSPDDWPRAMVQV